MEGIPRKILALIIVALMGALWWFVDRPDELTIWIVGLGAVFVLCAYRPAPIQYFIRHGSDPDAVRRRPLAMRTVWVSMAAATIAFGLAGEHVHAWWATAGQPSDVSLSNDHSLWARAVGASWLAFMLSLVIWTTLVLRPLGRRVPSTPLTGQRERWMQIEGHSPFKMLAKGCLWGCVVGVATIVTLSIVHKRWPPSFSDALWALTIGTFIQGFAVGLWADTVGEYAMTGSLDSNSQVIEQGFNKGDPVM